MTAKTTWEIPIHNGAAVAVNISASKTIEGAKPKTINTDIVNPTTGTTIPGPDLKVPCTTLTTVCPNKRADAKAHSGAIRYDSQPFFW
jgi:hypothetical protein